jgi:hypothetical protein
LISVRESGQGSEGVQLSVPLGAMSKPPDC